VGSSSRLFEQAAHGGRAQGVGGLAFVAHAPEHEAGMLASRDHGFKGCSADRYLVVLVLAGTGGCQWPPPVQRDLFHQQKADLAMISRWAGLWG